MTEFTVELPCAERGRRPHAHARVGSTVTKFIGEEASRWFRLYAPEGCRIATREQMFEVMGVRPPSEPYGITGMVYFAHCPEAIKVGIARAPALRIRELNCPSQRRRLSLGKIHLSVVVPNCDGADELAIQHDFSMDRMQREWFHRGGNLEAHIAALAAVAAPSEPYFAASTVDRFLSKLGKAS